MAHVFISYRHQEPDVLLAQDFSNILTSTGHDVFIDTKLKWGTDWVKVIRHNLEKADYLLVLLSREAAASEMVAEEIVIAKQLATERDGKPIILPLRLRIPFSEPLPYHISAHLRSIHQMSWEGPEDMPRLVKQLLEALEGESNWGSTQASTSYSDYALPGVPTSEMDPSRLINPGGALAVDSPFYISRRTDDDVFNALCRPRALVTLCGPRQTGMTSMMLRAYTALEAIDSQSRTAFVDFRFISHDDFQSLNTLWRAIANIIAERLRIDTWSYSNWQSDWSYSRNMTHFLDRYIFSRDEESILFCCDDVDMVFEWPIKSEFFSSVRAFFDQGATDPTWKKVRWLLGTSSEPSFFIADLSESPFNIGLRFDLHNFVSKQVKQFSRRYNLVLDDAKIDRIMDYIGGRPYLLHLLLHHWIREPDKYEQLFDIHRAGIEVFREHLHRFLLQFQRDDELSQAMRCIVLGINYPHMAQIERLKAAGLVHRNEDGVVVPVCRLYADFFKHELR